MATKYNIKGTFTIEQINCINKGLLELSMCHYTDEGDLDDSMIKLNKQCDLARTMHIDKVNIYKGSKKQLMEQIESKDIAHTISINELYNDYKMMKTKLVQKLMKRDKTIKQLQDDKCLDDEIKTLLEISDNLTGH